MIDRLMVKAKQALETGHRDLAAGDFDAAVNRGYYAVFYAAWAMFAAKGLDKPKTHSGMIAEFNRHFVKHGPFDQAIGATLGKLENLRCYADYTLEETPPDKADHAMTLAASFLKAVEIELTDKSDAKGS